MARKPRIEFDGAFYHVIARGNQRQKIFKANDDFSKYIEILSDYKKRYNHYIFSYVLMSNHVHLLIQTLKTPLSKILQGINQRYTAYFNRKYKTVGHLLQGRYKAILCDRDEYLLSLIKYIHMNPLRARVDHTIDGYRWSSHADYIKRKPEGIVDTDIVLRMFSEDKAKARKLYDSFMCDGIAVKKESIYSTVDQQVLGDENFVERIRSKYNIKIESDKRTKDHSLHEISEAVRTFCGVSVNEIRQKDKNRAKSTGKKLMVLIAKEYGHSGKEIAEYIHKDPAIVTRYSKERSKWENEIKKIEKALKEKNINRHA
jgi:REP element-mobilizing transposase RayT